MWVTQNTFSIGAHSLTQLCSATVVSAKANQPASGTRACLFHSSATHETGLRPPPPRSSAVRQITPRTPHGTTARSGWTLGSLGLQGVYVYDFLLLTPVPPPTAIMQTTARKNEWPLDKMCLTVDITKKTKDDYGHPPREGAYLHGLLMEGKMPPGTHAGLSHLEPVSLGCKLVFVLSLLSLAGYSLGELQWAQLSN